MMFNKEWRYKRDSILQKAAAGICTVLFVSVILFFLAASLKSLTFAFEGTYLKERISINRKLFIKTVFFTLGQASFSTLLALIFGLFGAYFVSHKTFPLRKVLISFSAIPLCVPAIVVALGYISTFGFAGIINRFLIRFFSLKEAPVRFLYSFYGLIICQGFYNFPLVMMTVSREWSRLDKRQADSARLLGAGERKVFFTITLNQLLPAIFSSCIPVFIYSFFSFMIAGLFAGMDGTTMEVSLYQAAKSQLNYKLASLIALTQTLIAFTVLFIYSLIEGRSRNQKETVLAGKDLKLKKLSESSFKEKIYFGIFLLITFIFFILPFICILILSFTKNGRSSSVFTLTLWKSIFTKKSFLQSVKNTCISGVCTSVLCTVCGFVFALFLRVKDPSAKNHFLKIIPLLPMSVSSVMLGLGTSLLVKRGNFLLLILAQTALSWPFAYRQIYASLVKIPDTILYSARLLSRNRLDSVFKIILPYIKSSILNSLTLCFAISAGDAAIPLTLSLKDFDTLALYTYRLAGSYRLNEACVCGLLLGLLCMIVFLSGNKGGRK